MEHFRILPSDERYLDLYEEQMDVLFLYHLIHPSDDALREAYRREKESESIQKTLPEDVLRQKGWTDDMIKELHGQLSCLFPTN